MKDNKCDNALNLTTGQLIVQDDSPIDKDCQWLITAQEDDAYITIEFHTLNVNILGMSWVTKWLNQQPTESMTLRLGRI